MKHLLFISIILLSTGCRAEEAKKEDTLYSPPFIVIDLDGDGVDFIPLEESEAYFDVDGDGEKEHTAWINSDDRFLLSYTSEQNRKINNRDERAQLFTTGGIQRISSYDKNEDGYYDQEDAEKNETGYFNYPLNISFAEVREDGSMSANAKARSFCKYQKIKFLNQDSNKKFETAHQPSQVGTLVCEQGEFQIYQVKFIYEKINLKRAAA